jgi:hypothetical protein
MEIHTNFEFVLFLALFLAKVGAPVAHVRRAVVVGMVLYGLSRLSQTILVIGLFAVSYERMRGSHYFNFICVLFVAFTLIQVDTSALSRDVGCVGV